MSWQLRGWLLLTFALLATALVAGTAGTGGTGAMPSRGTAVLASPSATATSADRSQRDMKLISAASPGYDGVT